LARLARASTATVSRPTNQTGAGSDATRRRVARSEDHPSELQSLTNLVCRLLLETKIWLRHFRASRGSLPRYLALTFLLRDPAHRGVRRHDRQDATGGGDDRLPGTVGRFILHRLRRPDRPPLFPYTTLFQSTCPAWPASPPPPSPAPSTRRARSPTPPGAGW